MIWKILRIYTYFDFSPNNANNGDKLLSKESEHVKDDCEKNDTSKENIVQENLQESAIDDSQKESSDDKRSQPISQRKETDVITIETDDDDDEVQVNHRNAHFKISFKNI